MRIAHVLAVVGALICLQGCIGDNGYAAAQRANQALLAACSAADQRYIAAVRDPTISPEETAARLYASRACWADLNQAAAIQAEQAARRWRLYQQPSAPPPSESNWPQPSQYQLPSPPPPPSPMPDSDLGKTYAPPPPPINNCVGNIPVTGGGTNPCPE